MKHYLIFLTLNFLLQIAFAQPQITLESPELDDRVSMKNTCQM